MALAVPVVPLTEGGTEPALPQQMTSSVPVWIAQLAKPPAAMALAVPLLPLTEEGGDASKKRSLPQQMTFPVPAWTAQLW
jgi:hypothetical protein